MRYQIFHPVPIIVFFLHCEWGVYVYVLTAVRLAAQVTWSDALENRCVCACGIMHVPPVIRFQPPPTMHFILNIRMWWIFRQ